MEELDPIINPDSGAKLFEALERLSPVNPHAWQANELISLEDGTQYQLHNPVVKYRSQAGDFRYAYINQRKQLGQGGFSTVFDVELIVSFKNNQPIQHPSKGEEAKVAKVQIHIEETEYESCKNQMVDSAEPHPKERAQKEYEMARYSNHLEMEEPVFAPSLDNSSKGYSTTISFLIMKKIPGQELFALMAPEYGKNPVFMEHNKRFALTLIILLKIYYQISKHGIIHRDLKTENILVEDEHLEVNIIDYGFAIEMAKQDGRMVGTRAYAAPEIFSGGKITLKVDVRSAGMVLSVLYSSSDEPFRFNKETPAATINDFLYHPTRITSKLFQLFPPSDALPSQIKEHIREGIEKMLDPKVESRFSIKEAINHFSSLIVMPLPKKEARLLELIKTHHNRAKKREVVVVEQTLPEKTEITQQDNAKKLVKQNSLLFNKFKKIKSIVTSKPRSVNETNKDSPLNLDEDSKGLHKATGKRPSSLTSFFFKSKKETKEKSSLSLQQPQSEAGRLSFESCVE